MKNLEAFLNALKTAKAPERVNNKFLQNLEFLSSNDRLFIGLLKSLDLTDDSGVPTKRYFDFIGPDSVRTHSCGSSPRSIQRSLRRRCKGNELSVEEVKNKFRTLTQGQNSDNVLGLMAKTFKALADLADWGSSTVLPAAQPPDQTSAAQEDDSGNPPAKPADERIVRAQPVSN
jgi:hypothetical protein